MAYSPPRKASRSSSAPPPPRGGESPPRPPHLESSPQLILDEAVAAAARTIADAASGSEISREQLSAAQDILNRKGITGAAKVSPISESFAREAFSHVFRLLGFGEINWPAAPLSTSKKKKGAVSSDAFNEALADI